MHHDQDKLGEFEKFLQLPENQADYRNPPRGLTHDLVGSKLKLALFYTLGSLGGYFLTLILCAQCSIGLSPVAWKTAQMMRSLDETWCAIACGSIFGIGPFAATAFLLTKFQHRYLLFRMTWLPIAMPLLATMFMTFFGTTHPWIWHALWIASAILTPYILEGISAFQLRQAVWNHDKKSPA